ncbi:MAG: type II secretion system protein [Syntrophobacterales bacterium]|nr:MAG: type II secretion system protein [Syntrophobacterales bacterium]
MKRESGFTLIEVIVALILTGMLAAAAGVGIMRGIDGYILSKETTRLSQKAQLAMERMRREMVQIKTVTTASSSSVGFTIPSGAVPAGSRGVGLYGDAVKISVGSTAWASGDTLVDGVSSFTLTFLKEDGSSWTTSDDDRDLSTIRIDLALDHSIEGVGPIVFSAYVNPRNAGNVLAPAATTSSTTTSTTTTSSTTTSTTTTSTTTTSTTTTTIPTTTTTTTTTTLPTPQFWEYSCDTTDKTTVMAGNVSSTRELVNAAGNSVGVNTRVDRSGTSGANNWLFNSTGDYAALYIDKPRRVRFHLDANNDGHSKWFVVYANGNYLHAFRASMYASSSDGWNCDTGYFTGYDGTDNVEIRLRRVWSSDGSHYVDDVRIDCAP